MSGCSGYNNSSGDPILYGGGSAFAEARAVFASRCSSCHNFHTETESQLVMEGLVVAKDLAGSRIYSQLRNSGVGGAENMPPSSTLPSSELEAIRTWIESL